MFTGSFSAAILATPFTGFGRQRQLAVEFSGSVRIQQVSTRLRRSRMAAIGPYGSWGCSGSGLGLIGSTNDTLKAPAAL
jgi:hypothetical protein